MRRFSTFHYKPILAFLFVPAILAELISEATPSTTFFLPTTLLLFAFFGYGLPILVIREFAVRCKMGIAGIIVLGLAYGIYNEGLIARTLIMEQGVPNPAFSHYSLFGGINFGWMIVICIYHALCSVLFPIIIIHSCFHAESETPWFGKKLTALLAIIFAFMGCIAFLRAGDHAGTYSQLAVFLALMTVCLFIAVRLKRVEIPERARQKSIRPFFLGLSILAAYILISLVAAQKWPCPVFMFVLAVLIAVYTRLMTGAKYYNIASLKLFAAGLYFGFGLFGSVLRVVFHQEPIAAIVTGIAVVIVFIWWARKILKDQSISEPICAISTP